MADQENDGNGEEFDEQFEQMLIENGVLVHALAGLLVRKGILKQEEIDAEMDKLFDEMESFDEQGSSERQSAGCRTGIPPPTPLFRSAHDYEPEEDFPGDCDRRDGCERIRSDVAEVRRLRQRAGAVAHDG